MVIIEQSDVTGQLAHRLEVSDVDEGVRRSKVPIIDGAVDDGHQIEAQGPRQLLRDVVGAQ